MLVNPASNSPTGHDPLDAVVGGYRPELLQRLFDDVPQELRLDYFTADAVPDRYRSGLRHRRDYRDGLDLSPLPEPMRRELAWCVFRILDKGGVVSLQHMRLLVDRITEVHTGLGADAPYSLIQLSAQQWQQQFALAIQRRTGSLPSASTVRHLREVLLRCYRLLATGYDERAWWQREVWDPLDDPRIPQRPHEPLGTKAVHFTRITIPWLRHGAQWACRIGLETGQLCWSSIHHRCTSLVVFDEFLADAGVAGPWLGDEPGAVRALMLDYLSHVRGLRVVRIGPTHGQPLSAARVNSLLTNVEQFYAFMHQNRDAAADALSEPEWRRLGPEHAVFYRRGEKPRPPRRDHDHDLIGEEALGRIMAGVGILGAPAGEGGLGDEQAMRILMLLARTGRRLHEILMLDRNPLLPLPTTPSQQSDPSGFAARLRYQQTKIAEGPDTILVDSEIVAIVEAQQQWADAARADQELTATPKYLFLATRMNRNGDRPYSAARLHDVLTELVHRLDIREDGRPVDFRRTHRFRHTKATSLLNAGVPLHVVQRYLGHLSPTMTMVYAQTLATTHEAEFLRYRKLTADARDLQADPRDLYDMLQLDQRTDRILPNGWCLLPPRQTCNRGNACLTCDKFATDATFLPELKTQRDRTHELVEHRRRDFHSRTGTDLADDNIWLTGRRQETAALDRLIRVLEHTPADEPRAVRGAGTASRIDTITARKD